MGQLSIYIYIDYPGWFLFSKSSSRITISISFKCPLFSWFMWTLQSMFMGVLAVVGLCMWLTVMCNLLIFLSYFLPFMWCDEFSGHSKHWYTLSWSRMYSCICSCACILMLLMVEFRWYFLLTALCEASNRGFILQFSYVSF